jgi:hypothetical protein
VLLLLLLLLLQNCAMSRLTTGSWACKQHQETL